MLNQSSINGMGKGECFCSMRYQMILLALGHKNIILKMFGSEHVPLCYFLRYRYLITLLFLFGRYLITPLSYLLVFYSFYFMNHFNWISIKNQLKHKMHGTFSVCGSICHISSYYTLLYKTVTIAFVILFQSFALVQNWELWMGN